MATRRNYKNKRHRTISKKVPIKSHELVQLLEEIENKGNLNLLIRF